jgi:hypothetical protein
MNDWLSTHDDWVTDDLSPKALGMIPLVVIGSRQDPAPKMALRCHAWRDRLLRSFRRLLQYGAPFVAAIGIDHHADVGVEDRKAPSSAATSTTSSSHLRRAFQSFELLDDLPVVINKRGYRVYQIDRRAWRGQVCRAEVDQL